MAVDFSQAKEAIFSLTYDFDSINICELISDEVRQLLEHLVLVREYHFSAHRQPERRNFVEKRVVLAACVQILIQTHSDDLLWIDIQGLLAAIGLFFDVLVQQRSIVRVRQVTAMSHVVESRFDKWRGHYFFGLLSIMENLAGQLDSVVVHLNSLLI